MGAIQVVQVEEAIWIANMVAQHGYRRTSEGPPIRYDAVRACLADLADRASRLGASVHMPRIGCGLAGGDWAEIEPLISETLCAAGLDVVVYDYRDGRYRGRTELR